MAVGTSQNLLDTTFSLGVATQVGADNGQTTSITITDVSGIMAGVTNVSTAVAAGAMITELQTQIDATATARASAGALQSRFEHTRAGLLTYEDNLRAAESKIRDVDAARESSELMKHQILTQVGTAMLAQANQMPASMPEPVRL